MSPYTMDTQAADATEPAEWKTLIPAYLLKEEGGDCNTEDCKTLVPMDVALRCLDGEGADEPGTVSHSNEDAHAALTLEDCKSVPVETALRFFAPGATSETDAVRASKDVNPPAQEEESNSSDVGVMGIPLAAEDCKNFLRYLANRPGEEESKVEQITAPEVDAEAESFPVWLHVYDLTSDFHLPWINTALLSAGAGLFHAGVEVHGNEFSFGMTRHDGTGVYICEPKCNSGHSYRESILLGYTSMSRKELRTLTRQLKKEWMGPSYRLISKNCIHFSDTFSKRLGVLNGVPRWVFGMATLAKDLVDQIASGREALTRAVTLADCNGKRQLEAEKGTVLVL